ncbi:MAG: Rrf2 family transcriptional regulator [Planctomycetota bacterium]|nr:MAG: Rrf2 family transcriptional regulator [Planctomycetota bacterium]
MNLKLHTDFGLRVLMYLAHAGRKATVAEIANSFAISRHHLLKVAADLSRHGWVRTIRGRSGGVVLNVDPSSIDVGEAVALLEGRTNMLECVGTPEVCRLEPGCRLRSRLIQAEQAFFHALSGVTVADLVRRPGTQHGLAALLDDQPGG